MLFKTGKYTIFYITGGRYFDGLCQNYGGDLLIINVVFLEASRPSAYLSIPDTEHIITKLKPRVAILTHFGTTVWQEKPWEVTQRMSQQTGGKVLGARDGMKFALSQLDNV
ncbi:hypothetical protein ACFLVM_02535 [Chloroflexota bacterium]